MFGGSGSDSKVFSHYSPAHPLEKVVVIAPGPLFGRSPRHLTSQVFALDSPVLARPSLELLLLLEKTTNALDGFSPRGTDWELSFRPGGFRRLVNISLSGSSICRYWHKCLYITFKVVTPNTTKKIVYLLL